MKLNLGCGEDVKEGYIIIDIRNYDGTKLFCWAMKRC
jgi:hypothetical protein